MGDNEATHYHIWIRRGRVFSMCPRPYEIRQTAQKAAGKLAPGKADRLVLACSRCPASARSKTPKPAQLNEATAAILGIPTDLVRRVMTARRDARRALRRVGDVAEGVLT